MRVQETSATSAQAQKESLAVQPRLGLAGFGQDGEETERQPSPSPPPPPARVIDVNTDLTTLTDQEIMQLMNEMQDGGANDASTSRVTTALALPCEMLMPTELLSRSFLPLYPSRSSAKSIQTGQIP